MQSVQLRIRCGSSDDRCVLRERELMGWFFCFKVVCFCFKLVVVLDSKIRFF